MFHFVVRHLRFLARIPFLPHFFDACLLINTFLWHRPVLTAMEQLEEIATTDLRIRLRPHKMGGLAFIQPITSREIGHIHSNGLLDVRLDRTTSAQLLSEQKVQPHHVLPHSGWISYQLKSPADVPFGLKLLTMGTRPTSRID